MDFVTTNIRFPRDLYLKIKQKAFEKKKSFGAIVREKFAKEGKSNNTNTEKMMKRLDKLAKENAKYFDGKSAEQIIREMRDEQ